MERVVKLKEDGNTAFATGRMNEAIELYSNALENLNLSSFVEDVKSLRVTLLSNRCAARLKIGYAEGALRDADEVLQLDPLHVKGLWRRSMVLFFLRQSSFCKGIRKNEAAPTRHLGFTPFVADPTKKSNSN